MGDTEEMNMCWDLWLRVGIGLGAGDGMPWFSRECELGIMRWLMRFAESQV